MARLELLLQGLPLTSREVIMDLSLACLSPVQSINSCILG